MVNVTVLITKKNKPFSSPKNNRAKKCVLIVIDAGLPSEKERKRGEREEQRLRVSTIWTVTISVHFTLSGVGPYAYYSQVYFNPNSRAHV